MHAANNAGLARRIFELVGRISSSKTHFAKNTAPKKIFEMLEPNVAQFEMEAKKKTLQCSETFVPSVRHTRIGQRGRGQFFGSSISIMEAIEQRHQGSVINVTRKGPFVIGEFEKTPGPADGEFTSFVRAVFEVRLGAEEANFLRGIAVAHGLDFMHLTLIIDALKFHDASLSDLTVSGHTLETNRLGEFAKELKISFVAGGGDRTSSVNNDSKGSRKKVTHSGKAGVGTFPQGGHVRSVDESGLIDDTTHVLERKQ